MLFDFLTSSPEVPIQKIKREQKEVGPFLAEIPQLYEIFPRQGQDVESGPFSVSDLRSLSSATNSRKALGFQTFHRAYPSKGAPSILPTLLAFSLCRRDCMWVSIWRQSCECASRRLGALPRYLYRLSLTPLLAFIRFGSSRCSALMRGVPLSGF